MLKVYVAAVEQLEKVLEHLLFGTTTSSIVQLLPYPSGRFRRRPLHPLGAAPRRR